MSKLRCFTVYWNYTRERVMIDYPFQFQLEFLEKDDNFAAADRLLVLNTLPQTIAELQKLYDQTLAIQQSKK